MPLFFGCESEMAGRRGRNASESDEMAHELGNWPGIRKVGSKADRLGFSRKSLEFQSIARNLQMSLFWLRERGGGAAWLKCERATEMTPDRGEMTRNQSGRMEGQSVRIFARISRIPVARQDPPNFAFLVARESRRGGVAEMYGSRRK